MSVFSDQHIKRIWGISGLNGPPPSLDPRTFFPSVETPTSGDIESGVFFGRNISPTSYDLDPYFYFKSNNIPVNDYSMVARGNHNSQNIGLTKENISTSVKTVGFKGPMYLSGWGYDVGGLPTPNNIENDTVSGRYHFHTDTPVDRGTWKTGPIDLRWHNGRKVWVGGQEMLEGYLDEDMEAGVSRAKMRVMRLIEGDQLKDMPSGIIPSGEVITIVNRDGGLTASSGAYCMVVDINYEWRPIYVGC